MNEKQKNWIENHCKELRTFLESEILTDDTASAAIGYAQVIVSLAKGNTEVRSALFDVLEEFDK